jgi:DNA-directed RNA polymerase omega subunit
MMDERVPEKIDSKFRYVLVASQRAEQIMRGSRARVDLQGKPTRLAMAEVDRNLIAWDYGPAPAPEPPPEAAVPAEPAAAPAAPAAAVEEVH